MDYQDKILEVVLYAAKQTQLTDSLIIKKNVWIIYANLQLK